MLGGEIVYNGDKCAKDYGQTPEFKAWGSLNEAFWRCGSDKEALALLNAHKPTLVEIEARDEHGRTLLMSAALKGFAQAC